MENEELKKVLVKNSFWGFLAVLIGKIGALVFTIILARFLLPEKYGMYSIVLSIAMIFYILSDLGVNKAFMVHISSSLAKNKKKIYPYYKYFLKIKFLLTLIASLLLILLSYPLAFYVFKNKELFLPLIVASFYIFVFSFEGFYTKIFYSKENLKYVSFKAVIDQFLRIVLVLALFYFIASTYYILGIFALLFLISLVIFLMIFFYVKKLMPELNIKTKETIDKSKVKKFVGFLTIAAISGVFFSYVDSIILGIFLSSEFVGYYRVAFSFIFSIAVLLTFPTAILLPVLSRVNKEEIQKISNKMFRFSLMLTIPATAGLLILGKYLITILYGYSYLPSLQPFYFLVFLIPIIGLLEFILPVFTARRKPQIFAKLVSIAMLLNLFLNIILIKSLLMFSPLWATTGAAIATLISWIFYLVAAVYYLKKQFKMKISLSSAITPLFSSLIMAGFLIYLLSFIKNVTAFNGIILIVSGMVIYFVSMFLMKGITREDLRLFKLLVKK